MAKLTKGTRVVVNRKHHGARGSTGRISRKAPERISGRLYYSVRLTGGRAAGWTMRFLASELDLDD